MAFDRSKFQGAKLSANQSVQKDAQANNKSSFDTNGRVGFLQIDEGRNVFRILPPHPDDTVGAAYLPKRVGQLKCEVPVYKDGEETDKTEIKLKNIFIATQHGGLPKDPIELYIDYVKKRANDEFSDKEEKRKFLSPITGWSDKKGWNWGISPRTSFVAYAVKDNVVGRLELYESMIKDMTKLAISEEAEDVIETDPFSDPNEGCELIITKQKQTDKQGKTIDKWEYPVAKGEPSRLKRESWDAYFKRTMVTDAQLEELIGQEPLSKIMGNRVYTSRDWDMALDGLRRFDEEYKFGIFSNDDFLDELQELDKLVPEYVKDAKDVEKMFEKKPEAKEVVKEVIIIPAPEVVSVQQKPVEDVGDVTTLLEMKIALKRIIRKEYSEEFLSQFPTSDTEIKRWYALLEDGQDLPIELKKTLAKEVVASIPESETLKSPVNEEGSIEDKKLSDEIAKLRNRRGGVK